MTTLFIINYSILALTLLYLLWDTRKHFGYLAALILMGVMIAGTIFRVLHFPGGDILFKVGLLGYVIAGILLVWKGLKNSGGKIQIEQLITGLLVLVQLVIVVFSPFNAYKAAMIDYPILAFAMTIILKKSWNNEGERNLLAFISMSTFFSIVQQLSDSF
jgi:hypothetical protein